MLQNDLQKLYRWADTNNMKFNANKFELLRYGKEQEIKSATTYKSYDDSNIDDKEQVRDLGIMMSNTATFTLHIRNIVKKARDNGMGVESVSVVAALSHADTLEISCHSHTKSTAASSGIHGNQKTYKLSKLFNERLHTKSPKDIT